MDIVDMVQRGWENLLDRPSGPLALRFAIQPVMASLFAIRDGMKDAREGRSPYLWSVLSTPGERRIRFDEAITATAKIMIVSGVLDAIYQFMEFRTFYPGEALIMVIVLAFIPYVLVRGPAARIARWWSARSSSGKSTR